MDGITSLKEAIRTVPIPGSPPPGSREGAAVGLAFLDMALRQNHIRRLTERLTLVEHRAATRTTEVDIRLSLLDNNQREVNRLFEELTSRSPTVESNKSIRPADSYWPATQASRSTATTQAAGWARRLPAGRLIGAADFSRNRGWQHRSVQPATTQT